MEQFKVEDSSLSFQSDKQLASKGRGSYDEWVTTNVEGVSTNAIIWYDNKAVCLTSTFATSQPLQTCVKYDRKRIEQVEVPVPCIVKMYNEHMGGCGSPRPTPGILQNVLSV